jgi:hypothetical protein
MTGCSVLGLEAKTSITESQALFTQWTCSGGQFPRQYWYATYTSHTNTWGKSSTTCLTPKTLHRHVVLKHLHRMCQHTDRTAMACEWQRVCMSTVCVYCKPWMFNMWWNNYSIIVSFHYVRSNLLLIKTKCEIEMDIIWTVSTGL